MPGAIWAIDPNNTEKAAEAIMAWLKAHKNGSNPEYDKYMKLCIT